ncbi:MAG TPA: MmcQ/YjbR family DNA-binding protein [Steroidobacteraceae bacterium]|nr:MmcQ/YjbR family DNA-binding protein [Steroidobacteraceae bacterium]
MTPDAFRLMALQLPGVSEGVHMNHPDFRARGRIFATLGYPSDEFATVMLTPKEQAELVKEGSGAFMPVKGGWGLKGSTNVHLSRASPELVKKALAAAWARKSSTPARRRRAMPPRRSTRGPSA